MNILIFVEMSVSGGLNQVETMSELLVKVEVKVNMKVNVNLRLN